MQPHPDTLPSGQIDQASGPGKFATALRGAARLLGRILGFSIVLAAGVAGWFAVEQYVFPELPGSVAAAVNDTPWPDEFAEPATAWNAFTLTYTIDGIETHRTSFDPATKRTHITYRNEEGVITDEVELAGLQVFERPAGSEEWTLAEPTRIDTHIELGVLWVEPVHLSALVPAEVFPFVEVTELGTVDGVRRFEIVIDAVAFWKADPISFYRWNESSGVSGEPTADANWLVDVRPDGYLVRWEGRTSSVETWTEFPPDLVFDSPLVSVSPTAGDITAPTVDEVTPPTTVEG